MIVAESFFECRDRHLCKSMNDWQIDINSILVCSCSQAEYDAEVRFSIPVVVVK